MRVLVGCEFSGVVWDAFTHFGHYAVSCDLQPSETDGLHIQGELLKALEDYEWDLLIAHPPCTYLASSGARWGKARADKSAEAVLFVQKLMRANVSRIAIENPIGILSGIVGKPTQIIQPWMFGHGETKATCLWLKGLPKLVPTVQVTERDTRIHKMSPSKDRSKERSKTYAGVAVAMATQWGGLDEGE